MQSYIIQNLTQLNSQDYEYLLYDSRASASMVNLILDGLEFDMIHDFSWVRVYRDRQNFNLLTSLNLSDYKAYMESQLWRYDIQLLPSASSVYFATDYMHLLDKVEHVAESHVRRMSERMTLYFAKGYQNYNDIFTFDMPKERYEQLSRAAKVLLYERLGIAIRMLYASIHFHMQIVLPLALKIEHIAQQDVSDRLKSKYQLSDVDLEVLSFLATGCTAKEIAVHLDRSYRTIQDRIAILTEKMGCQDKAQLADFAQLIMSYTHSADNQVRF